MNTISASKGQNGGAKTFHKFLYLPLELQRYVWQYASFHRRNFPVAVKRLHYLKASVTGENRELRLIRFRSDTPIPALFSVCREARAEARKHYKKVFVASHDFRFFSITLVPRFYTNLECDLVCPVGVYSDIDREKLFSTMRSLQIQDIALDQSAWQQRLSNRHSPNRILQEWLKGTSRFSIPLRSVILYVRPNIGTPYMNGSKGSINDMLPSNWDSLSPTQQCSLCSAVAMHHNLNVMVRKGVRPSMVLMVDNLSRGVRHRLGSNSWPGTGYSCHDMDCIVCEMH